MEDNKEQYLSIFPESPVKKKLEKILTTITLLKHESKTDDDHRALENAEYLITQKYLNAVKYEGDVSTYLTALMSKLRGAKYEFSEVCFDNDDVDVLFRVTQQCLLGLILDNNSASETNSQEKPKKNRDRRNADKERAKNRAKDSDSRAKRTNEKFHEELHEELNEELHGEIAENVNALPPLPEPAVITESEVKPDSWFTRIISWRPFVRLEEQYNNLLESAGFDFIIGWPKKDVYLMTHQYNQGTLVGFDAGQSDEDKWWQTGYLITELDYAHVQCANVWCFQLPEQPALTLYFRNNELYKVSKVVSG